MHLDSSFHLHGVYDPEEPEREAISITYGYSKDPRPDLKQVVLQLIAHHSSSLPAWLEVLSGNSNDKKTFKDTIKAYCKQLSSTEQVYVVIDSTGYTEETLKEAKEILWVMRVPETLAQAKQLVKEAQFDEMAELAIGYWGKEVPREYAGIQQRWLVVLAQAAQSWE